jgi:CRISPR/Cas system Type II protein with McrA/HNH and RuvC-like nuclease domain
LLILEEFDKERRLFEKLKAKFDETASEDVAYNRPRIPENVRIEVWRRDGGKCARCGSRESLEYDHIVPISKGGSNTARNIELLCEKHNRSKSNNVV